MQPLPASPKGLAPIVRRALTKDRRERYATAGAMAQELKAVQESVKPKPRSRLAIGAVAALLVVGAVGAWYAAREYRARWARDVAIPQIEKFIASDDYLSAFDLADGETNPDKRQAGGAVAGDVAGLDVRDRSAGR